MDPDSENQSSKSNSRLPILAPEHEIFAISQRSSIARAPTESNGNYAGRRVLEEPKFAEKTSINLALAEKVQIALGYAAYDERTSHVLVIS